MRTEWLEDLLAILSTKSLSKAAKQRFLTQPAFSRRIQVIEDHVGAELLDRSRKPAVLHKYVAGQQDRIREVLKDTKDLVHELNYQNKEIHRRIVIACQHAIVTSVGPSVVTQLADKMEGIIRLRSDNRDECYGLLITKKVDMIMTYRAIGESPPAEENFIEETLVGHEKLIPVYTSKDTPKLQKILFEKELPIIAYPSEVFLGSIMNKEIIPDVDASFYIRKRAETGLTLAALQLALEGVGVAWVPESIAREGIEKNTLNDLSDILPAFDFSIIATRLSGKKTEDKETVWKIISELAQGNNLLK